VCEKKLAATVLKRSATISKHCANLDLHNLVSNLGAPHQTI